MTFAVESTEGTVTIEADDAAALRSVVVESTEGTTTAEALGATGISQLLPPEVEAVAHEADAHAQAPAVVPELAELPAELEADPKADAHAQAPAVMPDAADAEPTEPAEPAEAAEPTELADRAFSPAVAVESTEGTVTHEAPELAEPFAPELAEPADRAAAAVVAVESTEGTFIREAEPAPYAEPPLPPPPAVPSLEAQRRYGLPARPRLRVSFGWTPSGTLTCDAVLMDERRELVARESFDPNADPVIARVFSYFATGLVRRLQETGAIVVINPSKSPPPSSPPLPSDDGDTLPPSADDDDET